MKSQSSSNRGRPREFDEVAVLERAVLVFRERGFHGTSITDLSAATKLSSGSLYKAFQDKRGVFIAALDHYLDARNCKIQEILEGIHSAKEKIKVLLEFYIQSSQFDEGRLGCMVVGTAIELSTHDADIRAKIGAALDRNERRLIELIQIGQTRGEISITVDAPSTARVVLALFQGFRVLGKSRHERANIDGTVETAMKLLG